MNKINRTYESLLIHILNNGYDYEDPNRKGVKRREVLNYTFRHEFKDGFPAITTKKLNYKSVVTELIWFLRGDTNIKYLLENNVNIWNKDAYNYYLKSRTKEKYNDCYCGHTTDCECGTASIDNFIDGIKNGSGLGDLGKVYGYYWRNYDGFDQIKDIIDKMINTPMSSEIIVTARNPNDKDNQALPCCFTEDMLVRKKDNYCKISDINVGDYVLTQDSTLQKVTDTSKVKYIGTIKELRVFGNSRKIQCTPNHPFLVKGKGFINSEKIQKGDYVAIPINKKNEMRVLV